MVLENGRRDVCAGEQPTEDERALCIYGFDEALMK